jgi:SAM-dependent methyltransferase
VRADDPAYVADQYATEDGLLARSTIYGPAPFDARDIVVEEIARLDHPRVLEVGCGWGELAARLEREAYATVSGVDLSPRMVELARERGVDAVVGDVRELEHPDGSFDAVLAAWMLYHVPDLDRALSTIARVLQPGGILVATTNASNDFSELWDLVGRDLSDRELTFRSENGTEHLQRHFERVRRRDLNGSVTFADAAAIRSYVGSTARGRALLDEMDERELDRTLEATKRVSIFVAEKA